MTVEKALQILRRRPRDVAAWETIAVDVYQPLLAYAASLLITFRAAPAETAHDIVHDVLINFYERRVASKAQISSAADLRGYLRRSLRNLLIDRYRRQRRAEEMVDFLTLKFGAGTDGAKNPDLAILTDEIIEMLPPDCSALFRQFVTEDLSPAEIADRAGASPATFYSRWYRCLQKAREIFMQKKGSLKRL